MKKNKLNKKINFSNIIVVSAFTALTITVIFLFLNYKTGDDKPNYQQETIATVLTSDNSGMITSGIAAIGYQKLKVVIRKGSFKGKQVNIINNLLGQKDIDELYRPGDDLLIALQVIDNKIVNGKSISYYRQNWEFGLFIVFLILLILYSKIIGLKAIFSFVATLYIIWAFYIPRLLNGSPPIITTVIAISIITFIILFSVGGFSKKSISAFLGTMIGVISTLFITVFIGEKMRLSGMTSPFAESLIFSGYFNLSIDKIFYSAVIIGSSGAVMDIAMDISASMEEIKAKTPSISRKELITSGLTIGKFVIGTMTTTLLLAYSGSYLTMIMLFISKEASILRILNFPIVAAEIFRTLIGSLGLVIVAPITAVISGYILSFTPSSCKKK